MGLKQIVFVSSPFKSSAASSANSGASNPNTTPKDPNKNQENLKDPFATGDTNFNVPNLTTKKGVTRLESTAYYRSDHLCKF